MALYDDDGYGGYGDWLRLDRERERERERETERENDACSDKRKRVKGKERNRRRERKSVCFVSDCAAMIDDAVNGILLETLWRVNRQRAG